MTFTESFDSVVNYGLSLKYIDHQTEFLCKVACQENGWAIFYAKEKPSELWSIAIRSIIRSFFKKRNDNMPHMINK